MNLLNRLDIRQLTTLDALLREKNLSRVADQLGITQQAVSDHLKKLRNTFDDRLFIRNGTGVQPTPFALSLAPKLQQVMASLENLLTPEEFNPATTSATFIISCTDYEQTSLLPDVLHEVRQKAPNLKVAVKKLELDNMAAELMSGEVDLVLTNPAFAPAQYPSEVIYAEHYECVAAKQNTKVQENMNIAQIAAIPQVVVSPSRGDFTGAVHQWFEDKGHPRNVLMTFPTFSAAIATIAKTDLCGFIPSRLLPDPRLQRIILDTSVPGFDVISVWHQRSSQDPLALWMRDMIKAAV